MLIGPGGVVALVIGAWAGMWAVRGVPGRPLSSWYPVAVAFVSAMLAFALLTGQAQAALQLVAWADLPREERVDLAATALAMPARPLVGAAGGLVLMAIGFALARSQPRPVALAPSRVGRVEQGIVAILGLLDVVDFGLWVSLRGQLAAAFGENGPAPRSASAMEPQIAAGATVSVAILIFAIAIAALRSRARR